MSTAIFGVPQQICAESYLSAVQKFDDQRGGSTCLKEIHFVDVSDAMVTVIQQTFIAKLNTTTGQQIAAAHNKVSNRQLSVVKSRCEVPRTQKSGPICRGPKISTDYLITACARSEYSFACFYCHEFCFLNSSFPWGLCRRCELVSSL